ncbi:MULTISPECIES: TonB-dependent siderophore receptor [unclassified Janthinobacterium]|uniref:TonB-dependent siderophore receptor n=1 Tax=unclassified Janthinobacterium TaxID=2610881 RepID=UPI001622B338|nr:MULTISPECIES: TonB-dependent siderophore receptor [unclassified Janthinobacterium]MBB5607207.1 outer membrane receptor for ferric coprogen and ferric-rhodotorulic acid [Janthinobacterium sp. S3T4]MBB5612932.1 outer membrane receptor for ferric coprogen and ferric-rhodotorulic acid [Janthinobacterium sp. S3M3]
MPSTSTSTPHFNTPAFRLHLRPLPRLLHLALLAIAASSLSVHAADTDSDVTMPAITVTGQGPSTTEGTGSYTAGEMRSATRMDLSLRETPQSVSIITRQLLDDLGAIRLDQALAQTTGIQVGQNDTERTTFYARGFGINNIQIDGMPRGGNAPLQDTILYDRIEVIRGASGLMGGKGDPSATINMVRKRPTKTFQASAGLIISRWDDQRVEADISTPLNQDGSVRGRAALAKQRRDSYLDMYHERKTVGMAIVEADLRPGTLLTFGFDFQDNTPTGATWGAVPYWNADGSLAHMPRNTSFTTPWSTWANKQHTVFTSLDQRLPGNWTLHLGYARTESSNRTTVAYAGAGYPNPATGAGMRLWTGAWGEGKTTADNFDAYASGPFTLLGRKHTAIIGWNGGKQRARSLGGEAEINYPVQIPDYRSWTGNIPRPIFHPDGSHSETVTRLAGGYVATRLSLADPLHVIVGARSSTYRTDTRNYDTQGRFIDTSDFAETRNEITPYAGVVFDINKQYSIYASFTQLFNPQTSKDRNNKFLPPETGDNAELGIKGEFYEGKLNASAALFHTKKKNLAELDRTVPPGFLLPDGGQAMVANGDGITAKGVELDLSGQITPAWEANGGYTYLHAAEADGQRAATNQPRHLLRLATSYRFDGALNGLRAGASMTAQSATYSVAWYGRPPAGATTNIPQGAYALFNLMGSYAIGKHASVQLNVNNLLDKKYYRNVGFFDGVFWGEPRNISLAVRSAF